MMINEEEETDKPVSDDAVGELFEEEPEEDELDPDLKDPVDEFGGEEETKTRDWE